MAIDFHMDFNPTEKFPKRQTINNKKIVKRETHLNLLGILEKPDDAAIVEQNYQDALKKYPNPSTCTNLAASIASINNEIQSEIKQKAITTSSGGSGRVENRFIEGYTKRYNELVTLSNQWQCQQYADQQAHQQYLNDLNNELQAASKLGDQDQTTKYLLIGGVGFVALVSLLIIFR